MPDVAEPTEIEIGFLLDVDHNILIANTEGVYAQDRQIRTRLGISAVAEVNGESQSGYFGPGRRMGMEMFDELDPKTLHMLGMHGSAYASCA